MDDGSEGSSSNDIITSLAYQRNMLRTSRRKSTQQQLRVSRLAARRQSVMGPQSIQLPSHLQHLQGPEAQNNQAELKRQRSMRSATAFEASHINAQKDKDERERKAREQDILHNASPLRRQLFDLVESMLFNGFILVVILLNTAMLCALTFRVVAVRSGWYFKLLDYIFLVIYFVECFLKIYVYRMGYFKLTWNIIDFIIVISNIADFSMDTFAVGKKLQFLEILGIFRAMRALKALRVLKTVRFLRKLQVIMNTCVQSIQSMGAIVMLISLFLYMFAVIGRGLYADVDPKRFGNLGSAALTLFQLLTLDDWFYIYTDAVKKDPSNFHIILYLIMYIALEYFIFLNLFVAVLVDNFQLTLDAAIEKEAERKAALKVVEDAMFDDGYPSQSILMQKKSSLSSVTGANVKIKTIDDYYSEENYSFSEKQYLAHFFRLLAALEQNGHVLRNQSGTLDKVVELVQDCVNDA